MSPNDLTGVKSNTLCGVVVPAIGQQAVLSPDRLQETQGLAEALDSDVAFSLEFRIREPNAGNLFGAGQIETIKTRLEHSEADFLIVDCSLTPVQQRNLENRLQVKVVDRTGLILEIFGLRARSAEGRLQVEMARLLYERSRLVRTWTHLERQRGGGGFLAGPGESQLEADRRMLDAQIGRLKSRLEQVKRTRRLQRSGRQRRGKPMVALVGYTNAGKSTLFNRLTNAAVFAADMPFATLDPTIRDIDLISGRTISLVDTVGFITDLPTTLVDSFHATIEEAIEADLLLHVRDISSEETERQAQDVDQVLTQLEAETGEHRPPVIEVWNKADLLDEDEMLALSARARSDGAVAMVSAAKGEGVDDLLTLIDETLFPSQRDVELRLQPKHGAQRAWLHENCLILNEDTTETGDIVIVARMTLSDQEKLKSQSPEIGMKPDVPTDDLL